MKPFPKGNVILQLFEGDDWMVYSEFQFYWAERDMLITVWEKMITDHASIPSWLPDALIDNTGPISNGATPHDMYYILLAHSKGIPFRCIYDMLNGQYLTKHETDQMFWAANAAMKKMPWHERKLARLVWINIKAKWKWMSKKEWDRQVLLMDVEAIEGLGTTT